MAEVLRKHCQLLIKNFLLSSQKNRKYKIYLNENYSYLIFFGRKNMDEYQIWTLWSSNRIGSGLGFIGTVLLLWLAIRTDCFLLEMLSFYG